MGAMKTPRRVLGIMLVTVVMVLAGASAASADTPVSDAWPAGPERSVLDTLLLFGGTTVGLIVVLTLLGLLTARNNYVPPTPSTEVESTGDRSPAAH